MLQKQRVQMFAQRIFPWGKKQREVNQQYKIKQQTRNKL
jgi:hypothetical protein